MRKPRITGNALKLLHNKANEIENFRLQFWKYGKNDESILHPSSVFIKELIVLRLGSRHLIARDLRGQEYKQIRIKSYTNK